MERKLKPMPKKDTKAIELFSSFIKVSGITSLSHPPSKEKMLQGKTLGVINGSAWIALWSNFFGQKILPEVKRVNVGNEAVHLNFMRAHACGEECPPKINIQKYARFAEDMVELYPIDAVLITCSTMNRGYGAVRDAMARHNIPVVQIDLPMMEKAVNYEGKILVIATHGPTIKNTQLLLKETADRMGKSVEFLGADVEKAWTLLGQGNVEGHNEQIASAIRKHNKKENLGCVVLAQLSMAIFKLSYPDSKKEFGVDVLTSAEEGYRRVREILLNKEKAKKGFGEICL